MEIREDDVIIIGAGLGASPRSLELRTLAFLESGDRFADRFQSNRRAMIIEGEVDRDG